jgi:hypothetical protein
MRQLAAKPRSGNPGIPPEFRAACGHPGTHMTARKVPVTIPHAKCDLTGVVISYGRYGGATVPGGGLSVYNSAGFALTVDPGTLNVTVNAQGPPGNLSGPCDGSTAASRITAGRGGVLAR